MTTRRKALQFLAAWHSGPGLSGCGGGTSSPAAAEPALLVDPTARATRSLRAQLSLDPTIPVAYRVQARQLFQPIAAASIPSRLAGLPARKLEYSGPTVNHVEFGIGWEWTNRGGDWIDANGTPQGTVPWATVTIDAAEVGQSAEYSVDVTAALNETMRRGMAFAFILTCKSPRETSTLFGAHPPSVMVVMADRSRRQLAPLFAGPVNINAPAQSNPTMLLPAFFEFAVPDDKPVSARLHFTALTKSRQSNPTGMLWLLNPDRSLPAPRSDGVEGGKFDAAIAAAPSIIGAHRYADTDPEEAYLFRDPRPTWQSNITAESNYSPELFGGAPDTTKYPYVGAGRWLNVNANVAIVRSKQIAHGPIAPGIGALRVTIPPDPQAVEGGYAPSPGLLGCRLEMPLPADKIGLCDHLFVRQYFSWDTINGQPASIDLSEVLAVYSGKGNTAPTWTDQGGKFGIVPTHDTSAGGFSGTSGGDGGWQMRLGWGFPATGKPGPNMGGLLAAWHLWDFASRHHPQGKAAAGTTKAFGWGKVGGVLYARRWYCIETELKLNSVDRPGRNADGTPHIINGVQQYWSPDGELRAWVDGHLVWEDTGMIFRSLPTQARPAGWRGKDMYPIRDLGVRSLLLNVYVGGVSPSTRPFMQYYAGLAYGSKYIGPMKGV